MNVKESAVVDIETTGGNAEGSRITEIAVIIRNGLVNRFLLVKLLAWLI